MNWQALRLSVQVTAVASALIFVFGLALALLFARKRFPGQIVAETIITLPMVLPPTVVGFYLLLFLGQGGPIVGLLGLHVLFTWQAAAIAAAVAGLPLMVQSARAAIANVDPGLENAARGLGSSELAVFFRVTLPLARRGVLAGVLLGSARALGEFGATLMVAGNIPGRTQTMPLAIYDAVQGGRNDLAAQMVLLMSVLAFLGLWWVRRIEQLRRRQLPGQTEVKGQGA
ncbi:MAG: molybdate ABC transporter permease subunit [Chloroflexi bacterium]|nr:molybdate ABC transporter permease subunit [Chloroflexota bacterium]